MRTHTTLRVFLTGGTGYVGSAIAQALVARGHRVRALVRTPDREQALPPGCEASIGDLGAPAAWMPAATDADAVVHAGYQYDDGAENPWPDLVSTSAILTAAECGAGRLRHVVYTGNAYLLGDHPRRPVDEHALLRGMPDEKALRTRLEQHVVGSAHGAVVRLGMVYGGAFGPMGGTLPHIFEAIAGGASLEAIQRLGTRWSLVHVRDVASLYVRIVESRSRGLGIFHATDGAPLPASQVVDAARRALADHDGPARAAELRPAFGAGHLGRLARDVAVIPTRALELGWSPSIPSFIDGAPLAAAEWLASREAA